MTTIKLAHATPTAYTFDMVHWVKARCLKRRSPPIDGFAIKATPGFACVQLVAYGPGLDEREMIMDVLCLTSKLGLMD